MCGILKGAAPLEAVTALPGVVAARVSAYAIAVNTGRGTSGGRGVFIATGDLDFPPGASIKHSQDSPSRQQRASVGGAAPLLLSGLLRGNTVSSGYVILEAGQCF